MIQHAGSLVLYSKLKIQTSVFEGSSQALLLAALFQLAESSIFLATINLHVRRRLHSVRHDILGKMHPSTPVGNRDDELEGAGREKCSSALRGDHNERNELYSSNSLIEKMSLVQTSTDPTRMISSREPSAASVSDEPFAGQTNEDSLQLRFCRNDQKATLNWPELPASYKKTPPRVSLSEGSINTPSSWFITMTIRSLDLASSLKEQSQRKATQLSPEMTPKATGSSVAEVYDEIAPSTVEQLNALDLAKMRPQLTKSRATTDPLLPQTSLPSSKASQFNSRQNHTPSQRSPINKPDSLGYAHCLNPNQVALNAKSLTETGSTNDNTSIVATSVALELSRSDIIEKCIEDRVKPQVDHVGDSYNVRNKRGTQRGNDDQVRGDKTLVDRSKLRATQQAGVSPSTVRLSALAISSSVEPNRHDEDLRAQAQEEVETNKSWILRAATRSKESFLDDPQ